MTEPDDSIRRAPTPALLPFVEVALRAIRTASATEQRELVEQLRRDVEERYCAKPGVRDDDWAYCAYAQTGSCGYVNLVRALWQDHGINLVTGEVA